ncbi:hypothetical protein INT48_009734 [Thamnidium elegans]|uniref:Uncharacterized protein n=1 Tax=Thamnidium elegans TaxID=101142 RepID=A0A8H7T0F5_9FUNG|nr:hypothetical protein INT48_009734 [Thamnidium elegans]
MVFLKVFLEVTSKTLDHDAAISGFENAVNSIVMILRSHLTLLLGAELLKTIVTSQILNNDDTYYRNMRTSYHYFY